MVCAIIICIQSICCHTLITNKNKGKYTTQPSGCAAMKIIACHAMTTTMATVEIGVGSTDHMALVFIMVSSHPNQHTSRTHLFTSI
jgi:hypothetical protein